jgi:hypothetical protein
VSTFSALSRTVNHIREVDRRYDQSHGTAVVMAPPPIASVALGPLTVLEQSGRGARSLALSSRVRRVGRREHIECIELGRRFLDRDAP